MAIQKKVCSVLSQLALLHVLTICSMEKVVWINGIDLPKRRVTELVPRSS